MADEPKKPSLSDLLKYAEMTPGGRKPTLGELAGLRSLAGQHPPPLPVPVDKEAVFEWLRGKLTGEMKCPVCTHNEWIVGEYLVQPMIWRPSEARPSS